ncbi:zinc metalloprotease [Scheffersomyces xylosifermentans]|uniref:zinc metalloprotease n=1 Tax=Scheffersomyces xylosifermentans TaxID=1304137 RepID=UPI00315C6B93
MISLADSFAFLDNPSINWKYVIVSFSVGQYLFENYLQYRQYQVLKKTAPPASLKAEITQETFDKSQTYSRAKSQFSFFSNAFGFLQNLAFIKYDLLPAIWNFSGTLVAKSAFFLPKFMGGVITQSIFFFTTTQIISTIVSAPLSYYSNFVLEEKYGFNKLTVGLWISDMLKGIALGFVLGSPVVAGFLKIIDYFGDSFIFYTMGFILFVQLVGMTIYPILIQPLFNKFTPLEDGKLKVAIEDLAKKNAFPLDSLFVVDGSKRSSHSNAYFVGLPWSKKIVLFDTLIDHSTIDEVVAVLAHEIGHWKLNHLPKTLIATQAHLFMTFSLFSAFIHNKSLYSSFGFNTQPTIIGFLLFNDIFSPLESAMQFAMNLLSRKHEYEADAYAKSCGYSENLSVSLIRLSTENLSAFDADWLYSAYHHSHPILSERLTALGYVSTGKVVKETKEVKED